MTLTELENYVLNFLQTDFSNGNWTQVEVDQYIHEAQLIVAAMVAEKHENFFRTTGTVSETANQGTVDLPVNTFRVLEVERISGLGASSLSPIPLEKINRTTTQKKIARGGLNFLYLGVSSTQATTQFPMYYYQHGQKQIELFPAPAASNSNSLRVHYVFRPAKMTAGAHVPFQEVAGAGGAGKDNLEEFHDILGKYAIEMCLVKEDASSQGPQIRAEREKREGQLMAFLSRMNVQDPAYVDVTDADLEF